MHYSKVWLCVLVLCLVGLFVPSTMLAQEDEDPPCCYPITQSFSSVEMQSTIILLDVLTEISVSQPVIDATSTTAETVVGDRQIPLVLPKDGLQAVNVRRAYDLLA